jgi:hypothetical protein
MMAKRAAVERKAYELWEQAGRPHGQDERFWFLAEETLESREYGQDHPEPPPSPVGKKGKGKKK